MAVLNLHRLEGLTKDQRKLLVLILVLAVLQVYEYSHGFLTFDVKEVADSVQATFHTAALVVSYFAIDLSLQPKDVAFAYGYERVEILAAFTNTCLILFDNAFGVLHNMHHLLIGRLETGHADATGHSGHHHAHYGRGQLCLVAQIRLVTDMVGLLLFMRQVLSTLSRSLRRRGASLPPHSENMATVTLALLGNVLAALVAAIADLDPGSESQSGLFGILPSLACSIFMIYLTVPVLISCGLILLLAVPRELQMQLRACRTEVALVQGVVEVCQWNFWPLMSERSLVGVVSVKIRGDDDENQVFREVSSICSRFCGDLTLQIVRD